MIDELFVKTKYMAQRYLELIKKKKKTRSINVFVIKYYFYVHTNNYVKNRL